MGGGWCYWSGDTHIVGWMSQGWSILLNRSTIPPIFSHHPPYPIPTALPLQPQSRQEQPHPIKLTSDRINFINKQMLTRKQIDREVCCICGNTSCEQSYDHSKLTTNRLKQLLDRTKAQNPTLQDLAGKIDNYYKKLLNELTEAFREDQRQVMEHLQRLQFMFVNPNKINIKLLSEVSNQNYAGLPTRKLIPIIQQLQQPTDRQLYRVECASFQSILREHTSEESIQGKIIRLKSALLWPLVKDDDQKTLNLKKTVSIRKAKHMQEEPVHYDYSFELKGVRCNQNSKQINLNQRKLTDNDLFQPIQCMEHFKRLVTLELRNNLITETSCRLIAVSLTTLKRLDIRGNKLQDEAIIILTKGLKKLQELFVCQNELSDQSMAAIVSSLKVLTLLWFDNNKITYKGAQLLLNHQRVKAISLQGNKISNQQANMLKLKKRYSLGYLAI